MARPAGTAEAPEEARARATYAVAARELLRNTLLDAARDELGHRSWADVTMAQIASVAGVSRQTLYNEFGSRDEFAQALVLREADRFLIEVEGAIHENREHAARAMSSALTVFLSSAEHNPLIRVIVSGEGDELLPFITTQGNPTIAFAVERLGAAVIENWPQVGVLEAERLASTLVRLALSYAALPMGPPSMTVEAIMDVLGPYVEKVVADPA